MTQEEFEKKFASWREAKAQLANLDDSPETATEREALQLRITILTKSINRHMEARGIPE